MSDNPKDKYKDQEKGDEVLRRLLKTPPDPKTGKPAQKSDTKKNTQKGNKEGTG